MAELLLLTAIVTLVILAIRRSESVVLDSPLIIRRPGQYHITLAPQLDRAQTFIEHIAGQFAGSGCPVRDVSTQYFEVHDATMFAQGERGYLLAVAVRGGMLYFQAINPQPLLRDADSHFKTLCEFSEAVLQQLPLPELADGQGVDELSGAVEAAAGQLNIAVKVLQAAG